MDLMPSEQVAVDFVNHYGTERCQKVLNSIVERFNRRFHAAADASAYPINPEWIYQTEFERELKHRIQIGLRLTDTYFTPASARQRILERIKNRKARALERKLYSSLEFNHN